jgi:hypothetical protein
MITDHTVILLATPIATGIRVQSNHHTTHHSRLYANPTRGNPISTGKQDHSQHLPSSCQLSTQHLNPGNLPPREELRLLVSQ